MNNNNKKTLSMFLTEANKTENKNNRESYWDDPNLFSKIEEDLEQSKILNKIKKGKLTVKSTFSKDLYNFVNKKLDKNIYYIIGKKPKKII